MSYAFDYTNGTEVSFTLPTSMFSSNCIALICGWWWASSLTANQTLLNAGTTANILRADDTVTSQLNIYLDTNTTNGRDIASNVLSTGKWLFIGVSYRVYDQAGTNLELDSQVFLGDTTNPPVPMTTSLAVAATGTIVTGTAGTISAATANQGWEGWAADVSFFISKTNSNLNAFGVDPSSSSISSERVLSEYFMPIWRGQWDQCWHPSKRGIMGSDGFLLNMPLKNNARAIGLLGTTLNGVGVDNAQVSALTDNPRSHVRDLYPPLPNRANRRMR